jgi:hypothetical protein
MKAKFQSAIHQQWLELEPIRLGEVPKTLCTADRFVVVEDHDEPRMRIDIYSASEQCYAFEDVIIWARFVVIGFGEYIHFVYLENGSAKTVYLESYFGHLYATEKYLLVASAEKLFCFDADANVQWISNDLGIDGVIISHFEEGFIYGEGEWDPPGGWQPFRVKVDSGKSV